MKCTDCKHYLDANDYKVLPNGRQRYCLAPQLRDYLEVRYLDGARHQNNMIDVNSCRDVQMLCGQKAAWFDAGVGMWHGMPFAPRPW